MADNAYSEIKSALAQIEAADKERHRRPPEEPKTPAERYAAELAAARSRYVSIDASWLK